jgi:uncharacterized membrane protein
VRRWSLPLLLAAILVFTLSAGATLLAMELASRALAAAAVVGMLTSMVLFVLSIWRPRRGVDWDRIRTEQRLWESGPLGRSWLRVRQRLSNLWKL